MKTRYGWLLFFIVGFFFVNVINADQFSYESEIRPGIVIFKVTQPYKTELPEQGSLRLGIPHIDQFLDQIHAEKVERMFPNCLPPKPNGTDLTRIYTVYFPPSFSSFDVSADMRRLTGIEYAHPWYIEHYDLDHNDPYRNNQYGLDLCDANDAHDISTGDPSAIVAIVDSGIDMDHSDLVPNLWINLGEDINDDGVLDEDDENDRDDDFNGRVDDFFGWDFLDRDGYPEDDDRSRFAGHGTHCAGIASAKTNNRIGIASVGYNCTIMPVRTGEEGHITYGYQGIVYAVRAGASVISCSWGGYDRYDVAEDAVAYAYDNDVMVIAAAGNDGISRLHYPSAYDNVIAVAATNANDRKVGFSNYGEWIDISAPGYNIRSTYLNNRYADMSGTSMASPFAASVAILIRATYPMLNVDEATLLLLEGADDIDDINDNFRGRLGSGRINAYQSLNLGQRPAPQIESMEIIVDDDDNGRMDPGESVEITVTVNNNEGTVDAEDVIVIMSTTDLSIEMIHNVVEFEDIEPGESFTNVEEPFVLEVAEDAIAHTVWLDVTVTVQPENVVVSRKFEMLIGHPDVLIVDDDGGEEVEMWYFNTIDQMGRGAARYNVAESQDEDPNDLVDMMLEYDMVVWMTGNDDPPLDDLDRWVLTAALIDGSNILLIGNRIGDDRHNREMLEDYFGAEHVADSVRTMAVVGLPDRPLDEDVRMELAANPERRLSPSSMAPIGDADSLIVYRSGEMVTGIAGVYQVVDDFAESRTIYLGFSFEDVPHVGETPPADVLNRLYNWFTGEIEEDAAPLDADSAPIRFALDPVYPNPFNGMFRINYSLPNQTAYRLAIVDNSGREISVIGSGQSPAGRHISQWNGYDLPSGIYFIRLTTPGRSPLSQKIILIK